MTHNLHDPYDALPDVGSFDVRSDDISDGHSGCLIGTRAQPWALQRARTDPRT